MSLISELVARQRQNSFVKFGLLQRDTLTHTFKVILTKFIGYGTKILMKGICFFFFCHFYVLQVTFLCRCLCKYHYFSSSKISHLRDQTQQQQQHPHTTVIFFFHPVLFFFFFSSFAPVRHFHCSAAVRLSLSTSWLLGQISV